MKRIKKIMASCIPSGDGSAPSANSRKGIVKFNNNDFFQLDNGVIFHLPTAKVMANAATGDLLVSVNFYVSCLDESQDFEDDYGQYNRQVTATYYSCTPTEFKDVYDAVKNLSSDEAYDFILNQLGGHESHVSKRLQYLAGR